MATISEVAKDFPKFIKDSYFGVRTFDVKYLSISSDNKMRVTSFPYDLNESKIVIAICFYNYTVQTRESSSAFFMFLDESGWQDDYYILDGWRISFDRPYTSEYHTKSRQLIIDKGSLKTSFSLEPIGKMTTQLQKVWPYIIEATKATTQKELDYIAIAYKKDIEIDELKNKNLNIEYTQMLIQEQLNAYKVVLDKIAELVKHATPTT